MSYVKCLLFSIVICFVCGRANADEVQLTQKTTMKEAKETVAKNTQTASDKPVKTGSHDEKKWKPLFDGKTLEGWEVPESSVAGKVEVVDGEIVLRRGDLSTGIKYVKEFPVTNYEIMYQAKRGEGYDFFGAVTFPVKKSFCTFVNGGWGGGVVGLSSIGGYDASENETTQFYSFKEDTWYQIRVRVTDEKITIWLYDENKPEEKENPVIDLKLEDKEISTRLEVRPYQPLGITSWCTEGFLRNIKYRELTNDDKEHITH